MSGPQNKKTEDVSDHIRTKIFGKKKQHEVKTLLEASLTSYPNEADKLKMMASGQNFRKP